MLECLEQVPETWKPPSPQLEEGVEVDEDGWDFITVSDYSGIIPYFNSMSSITVDNLVLIVSPILY